MRREEVAWLAGVSPDYVKRLEQGSAHPSGAVLRALSWMLRLSETEYELACRLAGHAAENGLVPQRIGPSVRRLLADWPTPRSPSATPPGRCSTTMSCGPR